MSSGEPSHASKEIPLDHYLVFERSSQDRKVLKKSGYPWDALLLAPLWAFSNGLNPQGLVLMVLYGLCALLMGVVNHGIVAGGVIVLWLGLFTAHHATDWLTSSYVRRGYKLIGAVTADSASGALYNHRHVKRHGLLREFSA